MPFKIDKSVYLLFYSIYLLLYSVYLLLILRLMFEGARSFPVAPVPVPAPSHSSARRLNFFASGHQLKTVLVNLFFFFWWRPLTWLLSVYYLSSSRPIVIGSSVSGPVSIFSFSPVSFAWWHHSGACIATALLLLFCTQVQLPPAMEQCTRSTRQQSKQ